MRNLSQVTEVAKKPINIVSEDVSWLDIVVAVSSPVKLAQIDNKAFESGPKASV
jgi:hypothetical protein